MKKKLISFIAILAMIITMIPVVGISAYADTAASTWSELSDAVNAAPTDGTETVIEVGANFNADSVIAIPDGANIVIQSAAGGPYTISRDPAFKDLFFGVPSGGKLALKDITLDGNATNVPTDFPMVYLWGGEFTMDAGATIQNAKGDVGGNSAGVCVDSGSVMNMKSGAVISNIENISAGGYGALLINGTLNIEGGNITGNKAVCGGGIVSNPSGTINMSGGSVTGNTSDYGGMFVRGTFNVSGNPDISGNKKSDNTTDCNLYLYNGYTASVSDTLTNTTPIGVTTSNPPYSGNPINITGSSDQDWSGKFTSDSPSYIIQNSGSGSSQIVQLAVSSIINVSDNSGSNLPMGVTYNNGVFTVDSGASGNTIIVIGTTNQNVIVVTDSAIVTLILNGTSITAPSGSAYSPIDLRGDSNVTLQLADGTTSTASAINANYCAGIRAASVGGISATLTITGTGTLNAIGNAAQGGAGIGGSGQGETGGNINISNGIVNAKAGFGAGIGGSGNSTGKYGLGGNITISGGTVNAIGAVYGAGIGGGGNGPGAGGTTIINGSANVTATGGHSGAGIGGGATASGGTITIGGSAIVTATGGYNAAGIGGGNNGSSGNITINGGIIHATSSPGGAGIGGGWSDTIGGGTITINGGTITAISAGSGAGIGGGGMKSAGTILITGGNVNAIGGANGAGIGGGGSTALNGAGTGGIITISGGTVNVTGGAKGAGIGGGVGSSGLLGAGGSITLSPTANVTSVSDGTGNPAIQAVSGSGNVINAQLDSVISASLDTYLKCDGNVLKLPANYKDFAFSASTASPITAYSDSGCATVLDSIITTPSGIANIPLSATIGAAPTLVTIAPTYALTVELDGGNGSTSNSSYASGATVSIDAGIKSGYTFNGWTTSNGGTFGNTSSASTTFTMPANATTIIANWTLNPLSYALTIDLGGGNGSTGSSSYASGSIVSIDAGTKSGYTFNGWTTSNAGTFGNTSSASTTFTMPGNATTITANWILNNTGGSGGGGGSSSYTPQGTNVIVDHNDYPIGTENKGDANTTVTIDSNKLEDGISKASEGSGVTIPVSKNTNITAQLMVKNVEDMAKKDMTLTIQTGNVAYNLATSAVDTSKITTFLGTTDTKDIPFNVTISNSNAVVKGSTVVISPVEFTITATYKGKTVNVNAFNSYVNRTIEITEDQAKKITTAVVVEPNGNLRHVPTKVTVIGGKYYAVINSLTNSIYTVIWHPIEFSDVTTHWAKDAINDMGSRMVVSGDGDNSYAPDRDITRAEFAAIVVRGLGLEASESASNFSDVKNSDWYCGYIQTAADYGIITGYDATTFGPTDKITREQAMTMISRAMKITGLKSDLKDSEISALIADYADGTAASDYATTSIVTCLKTGVITGRSSDSIAPKETITRAEVATIVQRLLQKSNLI